MANSKKNKAGKKIETSGKISKDILIGDLLSKYPQSSDVLMDYGFHCVGCMISPYETLEAGAAVHGIPLDKLLKDLNKKVK